MSKRPLQPDPFDDQVEASSQAKRLAVPPGPEKDVEFDADDFGVLDDSDVNLDLLLALADDAVVAQLTETELGEMMGRLQTAIDDNTLQHQKHYDEPLVFMASEMGLYEHLQVLQNRFGTESHLYPRFISQYHGIQLLLSVLFHENVDIGITVVNFITDMLNSDITPAPQKDDLVKPQHPKNLRNASCHAAICDAIPYDLSPILESCRTYAASAASTSTNTATSTSAAAEAPPEKRFGFSWSIAQALFQVNGFNLIFSFLLTLNTRKETHSAAVYGFLEALEQIVTTTDVFHHQLFANNIVQFLIIRSCVNTSVLIDTALPDAGSTIVPTNYSPAELRQMKKHRSANQYGLRTDVETIRGMTTIRLYCLEVLFAMVSDPSCLVEELVRTAEYYRCSVASIQVPPHQLPIAVSTTQETTNARVQGSILQSAANKLDSMLIPPNKLRQGVISLIEPLYNVSHVASKDALLANSLLFPHSFLDLLLRTYNELIVASEQLTFDLEQREFLWTLTNILQVALVHTQTHRSIVIPEARTPLTTAITSATGGTLHANPRHLFAHYEGMALLLLGLRSKLCLSALTILEGACDCDDILDIKTVHEQIQRDPEQLQAYTSSLVSGYTMLCNELVELGGIPLLFGYLQRAPSLSIKAERVTFNRLLYATHCHLVMNTTSGQPGMDQQGGVPVRRMSPLLRLLAKYVEKEYSKVQLLLQRVKTELELLYQVLVADPLYSSQIGTDINLGYSPQTATVLTGASRDSTVEPLTTPTAVQLGKAPDTTELMVPIHHPEFVLSTMAHGFRACHHLCITIVTVFALLTVHVAPPQPNSTHLERFQTLFKDSGVDPALVFTVVAESIFYAGDDTQYGRQLASTLEYFIPLTPFAGTTHSDDNTHA